MALTPETSAALKQALEAVISECGDNPEYADLVDALHTAEQAIPDVGEGHDAPAHGDDGDGPDHESPAEDQSADDMFAAAEAKHKERRKPKGGDHENPFAKKDDA